MTWLVSACLVGVRCRYDGAHSLHRGVIERIGGDLFIAVCPERAGGLGTPRPKAALFGGDGFDVLDGKAQVIDVDGRDVSAHFVRGARSVLTSGLAAGIDGAILKEKSPSCGVRRVHRDGALRPGRGVLAAWLAREGIRILSDEEIS